MYRARFDIESSRISNLPDQQSPAYLRLREIAERNRIRQDAGLPLLSVPKELRRMKEAADTEKFIKFADAHRERVYNKMLARARRRCGDPNWDPTGMLGGMWFNSQVERQARKLYRRIAVAGM
jgi:hypothetical protein